MIYLTVFFPLWRWSTQERSRSAATHVGNVSATRAIWTDTSVSTRGRSRSAATPADAALTRATVWKPTSRYTPERNSSCATSVGRASPTWGTWRTTSVSTSEANLWRDTCPGGRVDGVSFLYPSDRIIKDEFAVKVVLVKWAPCCVLNLRHSPDRLALSEIGMKAWIWYDTKN